MARFCLYFIVVTLTLQSCMSSSVRMVNDSVKNTKTYLLDIRKTSKSVVNRQSRIFELHFSNSSMSLDTVEIRVSGSRPPKSEAYSQEAYFLSKNGQFQVALVNVNTMQINENKSDTQSTTNYETVTNQVPVTTTTQKTENGVTTNEVSTTMETVTSTVPVTSNTVTNSLVTVAHDKNVIQVDKETLLNVFKSPSPSLRIYDDEDDYWNLTFNEYEISQILMLLSGKVMNGKIINN